METMNRENFEILQNLIKDVKFKLELLNRNNYDKDGSKERMCKKCNESVDQAKEVKNVRK